MGAGRRGRDGKFRPACSKVATSLRRSGVEVGNFTSQAPLVRQRIRCPSPAATSGTPTRMVCVARPTHPICLHVMLRSVFGRVEFGKCLEGGQGISRARMLMFFCAVFARIRHLRKSPQYLSAILKGKRTFHANLRNSP